MTTAQEALVVAIDELQGCPGCSKCNDFTIAQWAVIANETWLYHRAILGRDAWARFWKQERSVEDVNDPELTMRAWRAVVEALR